MREHNGTRYFLKMKDVPRKVIIDLFGVIRKYSLIFLLKDVTIPLPLGNFETPLALKQKDII